MLLYEGLQAHGGRASTCSAGRSCISFRERRAPRWLTATNTWHPFRPSTSVRCNSSTDRNSSQPAAFAIARSPSSSALRMLQPSRPKSPRATGVTAGLGGEPIGTGRARPLAASPTFSGSGGDRGGGRLSASRSVRTAAALTQRQAPSGFIRGNCSRPTRVGAAGEPDTRASSLCRASGPAPIRSPRTKARPNNVVPAPGGSPGGAAGPWR